MSIIQQILEVPDGFDVVVNLHDKVVVLHYAELPEDIESVVESLTIQIEEEEESQEEVVSDGD